jgi:hypothetical protein
MTVNGATVESSTGIVLSGPNDTSRRRTTSKQKEAEQIVDKI